MSISIRSLAFRFTITGILVVIASLGLGGETFQFKFKTGETYRILSTVKQEVLINREPAYRADQLNRLLIQVSEVKDGKGFHKLEYQNSVESAKAGEVFAYDRNYTSEFWRDAQGIYTMKPEYFVPTVLDVPWFPGKDLQPGDSWSHDGTEIHDLRKGFEIPEPFRFTMPVSYQYLGPVVQEGRTFQKFTVQYNVFFQPKPGQGGVVDVLRIAGFSRQTHYWDSLHGRTDHYDETYSLSLDLSNGDQYEFRGSADGRVISNESYDPDAALKSIQSDLDKLKLEDVNLRKTDEGITISMEDIRFMPDSSLLMSTEIEKLKKIAVILKQYPDRDLLVTGHTALAGTPAGRQTLSEQRAQSVAQFLLDQGVRSRDQIMFLGMGADEPVADNNSLEGMARNRRVEITIRDK